LVLWIGLITILDTLDMETTWQWQKKNSKFFFKKLKLKPSPIFEKKSKPNQNWSISKC
jgi:hypothetical protein